MATKSVKKNYNNKTVKRKNLVSNLTEEEKKELCKKMPTVLEGFEDQFEKDHKDVLSKKNDVQKKIISDLNKAISPSKFTPQNDFYSYINERWISETKIEDKFKYIVQVDDFRLTQDKVYRQLLDIVEEYTSTNKSPLSKCIKNVYESALRQNTKEESQVYSQIVLEQIDNLRKDKSNLWKLLAITNKNEIVSWGTPITWTLNPDNMEPTIFRCFINPPQLTLVDFNIYIDDGTKVEYKKKYKARYMKYLHDIFEFAFGKNHGFKVSNIFDAEVKFIDAMCCTTIKDKLKYNDYNRVTTKEALSKYKFDWKAFSSELGFKSPPDFFITSNLNYLLCGTQMLIDEWDNEMWRTYWIYIFIRQQQRFCDEGRKIFFEFQGKFVRGQDEMVSKKEIYPIYPLGFCFNTFLTNEYVARYKNEQNVNYVRTMAHDLKAVFTRIVKRNKWLQEKTKRKALKKLDKFDLIIAEPENLVDDPLLDYSNTDIWGNLVKKCKWRLDQAISLEGKPIVDVPVMDWAQIPPKFVGTQAYVVNACYTPTKNSIYIPLGYIQAPFVDLKERGIEYNLAYIGYTLGHEMSHSLDDWGSQFDENGKMHDWWTPQDKKKFKAIQNEVIKQYEELYARDGIKFDASQSIGEDLADISGLNICLEYLRDFQMKNKDELPIKALSFQAFFVYFAIEQKQKISKKAIAAQLTTNPHPLDKYRTNAPLSRMPLFRAIYNIKRNDKMFWHPTDSSRVWE
jgi:putative endopeptidase